VRPCFRAGGIVGLLLAISGVHGEDPAEILQRGRSKLRAAAGELAKYACTETVERRYYEASRRSTGAGERPDELLESADRLRLEVTLANGREIYSWPGATRFDSREIDSIIRQGPIGSGSFAAHLLAIVDAPESQFSFQSARTDAGERLFEYRYSVPLSASHYRIRAGGSWDTMPYEGSVRFSAEGGIRRLRVYTEAFPPASPIRTVEAEVEYPPHAGGSDEALLPRYGELRIGFKSGRETVNRTTFSDCRAYQAESTLLFEDVTQVSGAQSRAAVTNLLLPIGLPVTLELTSRMDAATAAAGDPVVARVVSPVRDPRSGGALIPAGAVVRGRLTRVEHHFRPESYFAIAMSFGRVQWDGVVAPFAARSQPSAGVLRQLGLAEDEGGGLRFWNSGLFVFPTRKTQQVLPEGFTSHWITLATGTR